MIKKNFKADILTYKPTTPSFRNKRSLILIKNKKRINKLCFNLKYYSGRNNSGKITVRHKGCRVKRNYRYVDFYRFKYDNINSIVERIEYDPNRNANIISLLYLNGLRIYILYLEDLKIGDKIISHINAPIKIGNNLILKNIPEGLKINSVEYKPGFGGKIARSAGCYVVIISKYKDHVKIIMKSGKYKLLSNYCRATVGQVCNKNYIFKKYGKAGIKIHKGIKPTVRGVAMNPCDHPHGGGEGKTSGGRDPVSVWGKLTKGFKTVKNF